MQIKSRIIGVVLVAGILLSVPLYLSIPRISRAVGFQKYSISMREAYQIALKEIAHQDEHVRLHMVTSVDIDRPKKYDGSSGRLPHWNLDFVAPDGDLYHVAIRGGRVVQISQEGTASYADSLSPTVMFVDSPRLAKLAIDNGLAPYRGKWGQGLNFILTAEKGRPRVKIRGATKDGVPAFLVFDGVSGNILFGAERVALGGGLYFLGRGTMRRVLPLPRQVADNISAIAVMPYPDRPTAIYVGTDARRDYVVGEQARLLSSYDGGTTWHDLDLPEKMNAILQIKITAESSAIFVGTTQGLLFAPDMGNGFKISWQSPESGLPEGHITALALSPSFSTDRTVCVSVGRPTIESSLWAVPGSVGAFCSRDGGMNWHRLDSAPKNVVDIAFSPGYALDRTMFLCTERSVYKSRDNGSTWKRLSLKVPKIWQIAISPDYSTDHTVFVSTGSGLWNSTDGGETWVRLAGAAGSPIAIALSPDYARDRMIAYGAFRVGLYVSHDGGQKWSLFAPSDGGDPTPRRIVFLRGGAIFFSTYPSFAWKPLRVWVDENGHPVSYPTPSHNP